MSVDREQPARPDQALIRPAVDRDIEAMQEIFNREVVGATSSWEWMPLSTVDWQEWIHEHTRDGHVLLVAETGGQVVGFAGYGSFRSKDGYISTVEDSIFLKQGYRGYGLGKRLLAELMEQARQRGIHSMIAAVTSENEASIALHQSLGFTQAAYLREVGHKFGRWLNLVLLQVFFDSNPTPSQAQ